MLEGIQRGQPGHSTKRRYRELQRSWRRRTFGRRFALYFWTIAFLLTVLTITLHLSSSWSVIAGAWLGGFFCLWLLLPQVFMPAAIWRWQLGAWGEEMTASELKPLKREGWTIAHDIAWGRGNHDHVVAGPGVYLLNTKNFRDSTVSLEAGALRVIQIDTDDSYLADRCIPSVEREAQTLKSKLSKNLGFPVHVYPVIVIWGDFSPRLQYVGSVAVVRGDALVSWIRKRPADLPSAEKRREVQDAVRELPRA